MFLEEIYSQNKKENGNKNQFRKTRVTKHGHIIDRILHIEPKLEHQKMVHELVFRDPSRSPSK